MNLEEFQNKFNMKIHVVNYVRSPPEINSVLIMYSRDKGSSITNKWNAKHKQCRKGFYQIPLNLYANIRHKQNIYISHMEKVCLLGEILSATKHIVITVKTFY